MKADVLRDGPSTLWRFGASEFGQLGSDVCSALDGAATYRILGPNEFIYLQEDDADFLYFVRSGYVRLSYLLEDGSPILFKILPVGESFGELGVFESGRYFDMATSIGTSSVFCIPARALRTIANHHPAFELALARVVARRYRSFISLTRTLGLKSLHARLSQCLLRLADDLNDMTLYKDRPVLRIGASVTQTDLGLMARGARGNVNRALKAWQARGWIAVEERSILIVDRGALEAIAVSDGI